MNKIKNWFLKMSLIKKIILIIVIFAVGYFAISKLFLNKNGKITYQTEKAVKGNLVVTVTGSGTVASTNSSNITTEATGVVKNIYVKDGDIVKTGDKIAELELDLEGQQKSSQAWYSYQQASPIIYAPISGTVSGLSLQIGSVINSQSSSNTSATTNKIANIKTDALPTLSINLTEIDVPKIKIGDKATITFDAFSDKTFTGKVISIDTVGSVSSGVTNYPTVILLDTKSNAILPNMGISANIITNTKDDVLLISSSAVKSDDSGNNYVQILKNGKPVNQTVEIGLSSDSQTEITSGLQEGDVVITST